ncbi:MAG: Transcriptional regulator, MerR family [Labilithrix sp.]|nr:Transcriptional regulator, MerR family [Labilithrix sp.]
MGELPPKLFFRIGEVAGLVGVEPHVLRYWEREFRSIRPTKSAKGQRVYTRKDVENLLRVRDLLYRDGFTIAGAKKKLQRGGESGAPVWAEPTPSNASLESAPESVPTEIESESAVNVMGQAAAITVHVDPQDDGRSIPLPHVRERLLALREEVESFLAELSAPFGKS